MKLWNEHFGAIINREPQWNVRAWCLRQNYRNECRRILINMVGQRFKSFRGGKGVQRLEVKQISRNRQGSR